MSSLIQDARSTAACRLWCRSPRRARST